MRLNVIFIFVGLFKYYVILLISTHVQWTKRFVFLLAKGLTIRNQPHNLKYFIDLTDVFFVHFLLSADTTKTYFFPAEISPTPFNFRALFWTVAYSDMFEKLFVVFFFCFLLWQRRVSAATYREVKGSDPSMHENVLRCFFPATGGAVLYF